MPNVIKYSTGATPTGCLRKGNMLIGNNTADYGLTFFNGIDPPSGGYTIYLNKASGGPSIYCPANNTQLIGITNQIAGANYTTAAQCLEYFASQTDKLCVNFNYEGIVTNGLVLNLDAGFDPSYPTTGTTWYDLSGNTNNGTLVNGPTFNSANSGSIVFDGVDDCVTIPGNSSINISGDYTIEVWVNADSTSFPTKVITSQWGTDPKSMYIGFYPNNSLSHYRTLANNTHYNATFAINSSDFVNKWNQVVGITSGSTLQIWNNGVLKNSTSWPGVASVPNQPLIISGIGPGDQPFSGKVASEKIYNRALTAAEVLQNYNAQKGRFGL